MTIRILLVDDQELVRAGFRMVLDAQPDMAVVGEAGDGAAAISMLRAITADVAVMDVRMPRLDGIEATRQICQAGSRPRVLMLTTFDLDEYVFDAIRAGAAGFLLKDTSPGELIHAIRVVAAGDALMSPGVTRRLIAEFAARTRAIRPVPGIDDLTQREREVVALAADGLSNEEIAGKLYLSQSTAKTHALRAMAKLGARDRAQLVAIAYQAGLVRPGWNECHPLSMPPLSAALNCQAAPRPSGMMRSSRRARGDCVR